MDVPVPRRAPPSVVEAWGWGGVRAQPLARLRAVAVVVVVVVVVAPSAVVSRLAAKTLHRD